VIVDDNSLVRHPRWREALLADPSRHPLERRAASLGITYVDLEGDIAVISGGAGATMALLDAIEHYGGRPANFLDTAGGSGPDTMRHMVDLVLEKAATDERVRAIVLNVTIAGTPLESFVRGAVAALNERPPRVPIFGCVRAAAAATQTMSLAEGTALLEAHGVQLFPDLRRAVVVAVGHAREDR
jgi:succinyl-CoA synthetase beta subunit